MTPLKDYQFSEYSYLYYMYRNAFIMLFLLSSTLQAQQVVDEPYFGVKFSVPVGWNYQKTEIGYVMGHNSTPGLIILIANEFSSMQELQQAASQGLQDENGTFLQPAGQLTPIGTNGLGGKYSGTMEWQQVTAYMIGLISTSDGDGVTMLIATSPEMYTSDHQNILIDLAKSVQFIKKETPPIVDEWYKTLKVDGGCKLTYMNTYSSTDADGSFGGYSDKTEIELCPEGYFKYYDKSDMSFDVSGGFGSSYSNNEGSGTWELSTDGANAILVLKFYNEKVYEYTLTYENEETRLNGSRYFRTYSDSSTGAPNCNF